MTTPTRFPWLVGCAHLLRPYQWSKNLLLFLPSLLAHTGLGGPRLPALFAAFISFSLAASAVYVLNDYVDIEADRRHPRKRFRPLASGAVPRKLALPLALSVACGSLLIGFLGLPRPFMGVLLAYLTVNLAYSFAVKQVPVLDVVVLTQMYVLRIVAGGMAADVAVTDWLLGFSLFQFLSLAFAKRYAELREARAAGGDDSTLIRGYRLADWTSVRMLGVSSGMLAALVMALYIRSPEVTRLYAQPKWLWLVCSALIFWNGRLWLLADRGDMLDDPVAFALRDRVSYWTGLFLTAVLLAARFVPM